MVGYRSPKPLIRVRILVPVQILIMSSFAEFIKGSYNEFKNKVEWPKWADLQSSTIVVTIGTVLMALFTFGVDTVFNKSLTNILTMLINLFN